MDNEGATSPQDPAEGSDDLPPPTQGSPRSSEAESVDDEIEQQQKKNDDPAEG